MRPTAAALSTTTAAGTLEGGLPVRPLDELGHSLAVPALTITLNWGGILRGAQDPPPPSFDVQLARLVDVAGARQVVGAPRLNIAEPWVHLAVTQDDGSATLIGLYIGGNESAAYVIPAWQLFDARLSHALPAGARLQPVSL